QGVESTCSPHGMRAGLPRGVPMGYRGSRSMLTDPVPPGGEEAAPPAGEAILSAAGAQIAAWAVLALINAITIVLTLPPAQSVKVGALPHLYDAGQLLAAGVLSAAAIAGWARWGPRAEAPRRQVLGELAITAVGVGIAVLVLPPDLGGAARKVAVA